MSTCQLKKQPHDSVKLIIVSPKTYNMKNLLKLTFGFLFLCPMLQAQEQSVYGWLRYDTENQDEYGICQFTTDYPEDITIVHAYPQDAVACAGAFANGIYYVYLYETDGYNASPLSFNRIDLATGDITQIADYSAMPMLYADMTYDYSTQTMYALGKTEGTSTLLTVDLETGEYTEIGQMERYFLTLACSYDGHLYTVDYDEGVFWEVDKSTGSTTYIGSTWELPDDYLQSMEFDHETGQLFWAGNSRGYGFWDEINVETGEATQLGSLGNDAQVVGLYIPFHIASTQSPDTVSSFLATADPEGELQVELSWTNPTQNMAGESITTLTDIKITRNQQLIYQSGSTQAGASLSHTDKGMENGFSTYEIIAVNEHGESQAVSRTLFVGHDLPQAPSNIQASLQGQHINLSWEAPTIGINAGYVDWSSLQYDILRLPDSVSIARNLSDNRFTDTSIHTINSYSYLVYAKTADGLGQSAASNALIAGPAIEPPYFCNFGTEAEFALYTVVDANQDGYSWRRETTLDAAYYYYNEEDETIGGDDWLISPPLHFQANTPYRLSFKLQSYDESYPEKVAVYLGTDNTPQSQQLLLGDFTTSNASGEFSSHRIALPDTLPEGDYHIGFYCHSDPYMFILYVTDVQVEEIQEGIVTGIIQDGNGPVANVRVSVEGTDVETYSDENGSYSVSTLLEGLYTFVFEKQGYERKTQEIQVLSLQTTTQDISLEALLSFAVSGKIVNAEGHAVSHARIYMDGYMQDTAISGQDGSFLFEQVYVADNYQLRVYRYGLQADTLPFSVAEADLVIPDITLADKMLPPYQVQAELQDSTLEINWKEPVDSEVFRYDNGIHGGRLGNAEATANSVYGSVYRTPTTLTAVEWFTENYLLTHATVNVIVLDLDADGEPSSKVLYRQDNVPNQDKEWNRLELAEPLEAPNGYMLALSYEGHVGLGLDTGTMTFQEHVHCFSMDFEQGDFEYLEEHQIRRSLMIRGIGYLYGEDTLPYAGTERRYQVFRLTKDQMSEPGQWQTLASPTTELQMQDPAWPSLAQGQYLYAVQTLYGKDATASEACFSNTMDKDMNTDLIVSIRTNTPENEAEGALVSLLTADGDSILYNENANAEGQARFNGIPKGSYLLHIRLQGFENYASHILDLSSEKLYTQNINLKEYVVNPFNLEITEGDEPNERILRWNITDGLFDDFESHKDFAINSAGEIGWSYIDADGKPTSDINNVEFENSTAPKAFIIFNPYQTDPRLNMIDQQILPYSGEKFLAAFPSNPGPNDDYFISPALDYNQAFSLSFKAKSHSTAYGEELIQVGYSVSGNEADDFVWLNDNDTLALPMGDWQEYRYEMPAEARHTAIRCLSNDAFILMIDDVFVGIEPPQGIDPENIRRDLAFNLYLDSTLVESNVEANEFLFTGLEAGKHTAGVAAVFASTITPITAIEFEVKETGNESFDETLSRIRIWPNPATDRIRIEGEYERLSLYTLSGQKVTESEYTSELTIPGLRSGLYLLRIEKDGSSRIFKLSVR